MFLEGLGIAGYRSFGFPVQRFGPLSKINIIIGQNNAGKSNLLRFLSDCLDPICSAVVKPGGGRGMDRFSDLDRPRGIDTEAFEIEFGLQKNGEAVEALRAALGPKQLIGFLDRVIGSDTLSGPDDLIWIPYRADTRTTSPMINSGKLNKGLGQEGLLRPNEWQALFRALLPGRGAAGNPDVLIPEIVHHLNPYSRAKPSAVKLIPAFRKVSDEPEALESGGRNIQHLAELQNPALAEREKHEETFGRIHKFLRDVTGHSEATLQVPHPHDMILVDMNDRVLPLESLGTGIHQVVILAAASTMLEEQIVCIEEPEIHLHPTLQRKLLRTLATKLTTNISSPLTRRAS